MKNYKFIIRGKVQGVSYRKNVSQNSSKENFNGFVKNLSDGSVEACVACNESDLSRFVEILEKGSPESIVKKIERFSHDETFNSGFEIKY
ncbi:MAG: acylphosphatase [Helicobacteraceae bacterium CG2_30_36_10]|nr:MAG: acylphosphatase [Helicobacteraceae bacterium CG2_30_36_10]